MAGITGISSIPVPSSKPQVAPTTNKTVDPARTIPAIAAPPKDVAAASLKIAYAAPVMATSVNITDTGLRTQTLSAEMPINFSSTFPHMIQTTPSDATDQIRAVEGDRKLTFILTNTNTNKPTMGNFIGSAWIQLNGGELLDTTTQGAALNMVLTSADGKLIAGSMKVVLGVDTDGDGISNESYVAQVDDLAPGANRYSIDLGRFKHLIDAATGKTDSKTLSDAMQDPQAVVVDMSYGIASGKDVISNGNLVLSSLAYSPMNAEAVVTNPAPPATTADIQYIPQSSSNYTFNATLKDAADATSAVFVFYKDGKKLGQSAPATITGSTVSANMTGSDMAAIFSQGTISCRVQVTAMDGLTYLSPTESVFRYSEQDGLNGTNKISLSHIYGNTSAPAEESGYIYASDAQIKGTAIDGAGEIPKGSSRQATAYKVNYSWNPGDAYKHQAGIVFNPNQWGALRFLSTGANMEFKLTASAALTNGSVNTQIGVAGDDGTIYIFSKSVESVRQGTSLYTLPLSEFKYDGYIDKTTNQFVSDKGKSIDSIIQTNSQAYIMQMSVAPKPLLNKAVAADTLTVSAIDFSSVPVARSVIQPAASQGYWKGDPITVKWADLPGVDKYFVQVFDSTGKMLVSQQATQRDQNTLATQLPQGQYSIKVIAQNTAGVYIPASGVKTYVSEHAPSIVSAYPFGANKYGSGNPIEIKSTGMQIPFYKYEPANEPVSASLYPTYGVKATFVDVDHNWYTGGIGFIFDNDWINTRAAGGNLKLNYDTQSADRLLKVKLELRDRESGQVVGNLQKLANFKAGTSTLSIPMSGIYDSANHNSAYYMNTNSNIYVSAVQVEPLTAMQLGLTQVGFTK